MLYVNGDGHVSAAEAVNTHTFAQDDVSLFYMGRAPHPENLAVSWGKLLSLTLRSAFRCDAEGHSSNARIIESTRNWLATAGHGHPDLLLVIQWNPSEPDAHNSVWQFHLELQEQNIRHIFFNRNGAFESGKDQQDWGVNYIGPYDSKQSYCAVVQSKHIDTVMPNSDYFGRDGHSVFFRFVLDYIVKHQFV
jgi:hypothetical protein